MLLKLTNEAKADQEHWDQDDQKEFQRYLQNKKRQKSQQPTQSSVTQKVQKAIVDIYGGGMKKEKNVSVPRRAIQKDIVKDMKNELDHKTFETQMKEQQLLKLQRELEKIRTQRRDVCTPFMVQDRQMNSSKLSYRSTQSFSQSSLVKHSSAIFNNEKLEAKVKMLEDLIDDAIEKNKWEKFDTDSYAHLLDRLRVQKKFDETKIYSLMPELKSMSKLGENTERLKFLTSSANLISHSGISQCYTKIQERIVHRKEKVEEKTVIFKEEEEMVSSLKLEWAQIKKQIYVQKKELRKWKNINERLKLTEDEKEEIMRRTKKEVSVIRCFDSLIIMNDYLQSRCVISQEDKLKIMECFDQFKIRYGAKVKNDYLGNTSRQESQLDISLTSQGPLQKSPTLNEHPKMARNSNVSQLARSPSKLGLSTSLNQTRPQSPPNLGSKIKNFFRLKIEHEMRTQKWQAIAGSEPDLESIQDQFMHCMFRLNSVQQTFNEMQQQCKDKKKSIEEMKGFIEVRRKDLAILKDHKSFKELVTTASEQSVLLQSEEEQLTVNQLMEAAENNQKLQSLTQEQSRLTELKFKIDALQMEILVRVSYRMSQLKVVGKDQVKYDKHLRDIIQEYDLVSKAFNLNVSFNDEIPINDSNKKENPHLTPSSKVSDDQLNSDINLKNQEILKKKKQLKKQHSQQNPGSCSNKKKQAKQKLPENFDVMRFLKKVLHKQVEDNEDKNKFIFNKIRSLIKGFSALSQEQDQTESIHFNEDIDAQHYKKYQDMMNQAIQRKNDMQKKTFSDNMSVVSYENDESPGKAQQTRDKPNHGQSTVHFAKHNNEEASPLDEESKMEVEYLNKTRVDQKIKLMDNIAKAEANNAVRPRSAPKYQRAKGAVASHQETHVYQQEVKTYRRVMSNLERTEQIFIQKFKKGQTDVYHSIQNPNSLRTHRTALFKLFDKTSKKTPTNKTNQNLSMMQKSSVFKNVVPDKKQNVSMVFGRDKFNQLDRSIQKHQKILVNMYGSTTPTTNGQQVQRIRPQTARSIQRGSNNKSILRDTLILPIAREGSSTRNKETSNYKIEFGIGRNNFADYMNGALTNRQKPKQQFVFPMDAFKTLNPQRPTEKSIFTKHASQTKLIPIRPQTAMNLK